MAEITVSDIFPEKNLSNFDINPNTKIIKKISATNSPSETTMQLDEETYRIGVLGGSFNPPTWAHMEMAIEALNLGHVDEVWFVPCGDRVDKKLSISGEIRLKMVHIIVEDFFNGEFPVKVKDTEIKNGISIPTYHLMKQFISEKKSNQQFFFIMGSNLLKTYQNWDEFDKLKSEIPFLIYRKVEDILKPETLPDNYIIINSTFIASNSTEVRKRIYSAYNINDTEVENDPDHHTSFQRSATMDLTIPLSSGNCTRRKKKTVNKFLGLYGILPYSLIDFISKNKIYNKQEDLDDEDSDQEKNQEQS